MSVTLPVLFKMTLNVEEILQSCIVYYFSKSFWSMTTLRCGPELLCCDQRYVFWSVSHWCKSLATLHHSDGCSLFLKWTREIHCVIPSSDKHWVSQTSVSWKPNNLASNSHNSLKHSFHQCCMDAPIKSVGMNTVKLFSSKNMVLLR